MGAHGRAFCYSLEIRSDPLWRTAAAATDGEQAARAAASARLRELLCLRLRKAGRDKVFLQLPVGLQLLPVLGELEDVDRRERDVAEDRNHRKRPKDLQSQSPASPRWVWHSLRKAPRKRHAARRGGSTTGSRTCRTAGGTAAAGSEPGWMGRGSAMRRGVGRADRTLRYLSALCFFLKRSLAFESFDAPRVRPKPNARNAACSAKLPPQRSPAAAAAAAQSVRVMAVTPGGTARARRRAGA